MVVFDKEYMKLVVGKVIDHITQGSFFHTDLAKRGDDDCFSIIHNIGTGAYVDSDKTNTTYIVG